MRYKLLFLSFLCVILCTGCSREFDSEIVLEVEATAATVTTEELVEDLPVLEGIDAIRSCQDKDTYQWMVALKADDVDYIEFLNLSDQQTPYRRYEGEDIQEVIDLFQGNECYRYTSSASWRGWFTKEFHIMMKDGTAHTVCSIEGVTTVIDGAAYDTISSWLNICWPETGNAPLPEGWEQQVASRAYHVSESELSILGDLPYRTDRERLDREYDSSLLMGSASRSYPIGRSTLVLSAEKASAAAVSLCADWSGSFGGRQVMVEQEYWLEQWDDVFDGYMAIESDALLEKSVQSFSSPGEYRWTVEWKSVYGKLEAGNYRIGMTAYEVLNGIQQNKTTCYAKFTVS